MGGVRGVGLGLWGLGGEVGCGDNCLLPGF